MNTLRHSLSLIVPAILSMNSIATGAIVVSNAGGNSGYVTSGDPADVSGFDLNGGNAVVVIATSESYSDFAVTFGGEALTAVRATEGAQSAEVFYLINPSSTSGDLVISSTDGGGSGSDFSYSYFALGNVGALADSDVQTSTSTADITVNYGTSADGGFVVAGLINNRFNGNASSSVPSLVTPPGGNLDTVIFSNATGSNNRSSHNYGSVATAGANSETFENFSGRNAVAVVAFDAVVIPEPSSMILVGLGFITSLLIRKQKN